MALALVGPSSIARLTPPPAPSTAAALSLDGLTAAGSSSFLRLDEDAPLRLRSLSAVNAAMVCLWVQSTAEGRNFAVVPLSAAIGIGASLVACSADVVCKARPVLMRYHMIPVLQGYAAAHLLRHFAKLMYAEAVERFFTPAAPPPPPPYSLYGRGASLAASSAGSSKAGGARGSRGGLRGGGRGSVSRIAARIGAVPRVALSPATRAGVSSWRWAVGAGAKLTRSAKQQPQRQQQQQQQQRSAVSSGTPSRNAASARPARAGGRPNADRGRLPIAVPAAAAAPLTKRRKRVLILISDTGGGHRASAQALAETLHERHGDAIETSIVDVWTQYGPFPFGKKIVPYYRGLAKRPALWWAHFKASAFKPCSYLMQRLMTAFSHRGFRECIEEYQPDVVVSMHPLCQAVPIEVLQSMRRNEIEAQRRETSARYLPRKVPFVTVVTDLATPHPFWLHAKSDLCFVPSAEFERAARVRGLSNSQLRLHGLPVRPAFSLGLQQAEERAAAGEPAAEQTTHPMRSAEVAASLGFKPDRKTVLVVGGGDGVGKLEQIVDAMAARMAERNAAAAAGGREVAQLVVICGKNHKLRQQLRERDFGPHLHVVVEGFVTRMSEYMSNADCIVTKAGPGTIAEACCCGLPIMLSGHLPGQESGNVGFVVDGGFGAYSSDPSAIAKTVAGWLDDDEKMASMSERSLRASRPGATRKIADDIAALVKHDHLSPPRAPGGSTFQQNLPAARNNILHASRAAKRNRRSPLQRTAGAMPSPPDAPQAAAAL